MNSIKLSGKEYPLRFDLNTMEQIQKRYGEITDLFEKIKDVGESRWVLHLIISEGIAYGNYTQGSSLPIPTEQEIGALVTLRDLNDRRVVQAIVDAFNEGLGGEKNVTAGELMETAAQMQKSTSPA